MLCSEWSPPTAATRKLLHLCVSTSMAVFKNYPYLFISSDKFLCYSPVVVCLYSSPPPHHFYLTLTTGRHYLLLCWALLLLYFPKPWMTCLSLTSLDRKLQSIAISCTHNRYDPCVSMYDPHAHSIVVSDEKLYHFKADTQFSCSRFLFYILGLLRQN